MKKMTTNKMLASFLTAQVFLFSSASGSLAEDVTIDVNVEIRQEINTSSEAMSFGTVDVDPAAGTIDSNNCEEVTINARLNGSSAVPVVKGGSAVNGGKPGKIEITSPMTFDIEVNYPDDGSVSFMSTTNSATTNLLKLVKIAENSTDATNDLPHVGGTPTNIDIGGVLQIDGNVEPGSYKGKAVIGLTYK